MPSKRAVTMDQVQQDLRTLRALHARGKLASPALLKRLNANVELARAEQTTRSRVLTQAEQATTVMLSAFGHTEKESREVVQLMRGGMAASKASKAVAAKRAGKRG